MRAKKIRKKGTAISVQKVTDFLNQYGWGRTLIQNLPSYDSVIENINATGLATRAAGGSRGCR